MVDLIPSTVSDITQTSSMKSLSKPEMVPQTLSVASSAVDTTTVTATDKLVFDTTVEVIRADGLHKVVAFQFYFRHFEGIQGLMGGGDGKLDQLMTTNPCL